MKRFVRFGVAGVSILLASGLLARWWLSHPDAIPRFPESFWVWLGNIYGVENGEDFSDLETIAASGVSLLIVLSIFALGRLLWSRIGSESGRRSE